MNQPGSSGELATLARALGCARFASMPARSSSTSLALSSPRSTTAPSAWNASICCSDTSKPLPGRGDIG